jgi:hypothetical protein
MNVMINDMSKDLNLTVQGIQVAISILCWSGRALIPPGAS